MSAHKILEIACFNLASALIAQENGADRIELCEHYSKGGLTPSYELIRETRRRIRLPLHVIIRPADKGFVYSEVELRRMEQDILFCKETGVNGVVFGVLTKSNDIDIAVCKRLLALARPMSVTFHRAFDSCNDLFAALEQLADLGIERVLTSGGVGNTYENYPVLDVLLGLSGQKIVVMPGGGVRSTNIKRLVAGGFKEFHSAAISGKTETADAGEIQALKQLLTTS